MPAAIVERYNLAYFAVPKAGSTSMKATIYNLEHETAPPNKVHPEYRTFPLTPTDITDILLANLAPESFVATPRTNPQDHREMGRDLAPGVDSWLHLASRNQRPRP